MTRLIIGLVVLLLAIVLGIQLNHDPGYLLIAVNHWTIETTLWFAILGIILCFFLLHWLILFVQKLCHSRSNYRAWRARRRAQIAQAKTRKGLIEFSEGYWDAAKTHLIKALPDTDTPLLNYLTAARAAQEMGDSQLRDDYLREAQQSMPEARIAVELTQAQLQLANQQWEQALATLRHLQDLAPRHPYVLKLLMHLYQEVRDWPQLIALLPELKRNNIISAAEYEQLQLHAYKQAMADCIRLSQRKELDALVQSLPKAIKDSPDLMAQYCSYLIKDNQQAQAEAILRRSLRKQFNEQLIKLYGQIHVNEQQLPFAESFIKKHPNSSVLLLTLGRLCIAQHLWGKARSYFENSIALHPSPEAYAEIGALYERFGEQHEACQAFRQGLKLIDGSYFNE
ncbi:protoporphyrinogen oxidase [Legionella quinlivanii]|uniref:Protoporphyrinogen oxidase n=1 Tax=Legionella quinlivanii TaxID=45073 RepID=A0A364LF30_9GAMM|nr:heme biosynthesis HemY N-terminal domain-containing protein [Legionella quinlivanii]RAP34517.1 protoporphyrinogen oxidase [Legionella quinlivanii]